MIASVAGTVIERGLDHVVIECGGVGYRLDASTETLAALAAPGGEARLLSEMIVREDSISLYGFATEEERDLFRLLITVSGVGPKVAIAALSTRAPRQLADAVFEGDPQPFVAVSGIGRRTAERIIVELRGKVEEMTSRGRGESEQPRGGPHEMARAGLMGLGYDSAEAESLLAEAEGESAEELIASALRRASTGFA